MARPEGSGPFRTGLTSLPSHALMPAELPASLRALLLPFSCSHFLLTSGSRVGSAEILRSSLQTRKHQRPPENGSDFQAEIPCKHLARGTASGPSEHGAHPPHPPGVCCWNKPSTGATYRASSWAKPVKSSGLPFPSSPMTSDTSPPLHTCH